MGALLEEVTVTFDRGLATVDSPLRSRNSLAGMDNVWLSPTDRGAVEAMPGYSKINSSEVSGATWHGAARVVKDDGTDWNLLFYRDGSNQDFVIRMDDAGATANVWIHSDTPALDDPDVSVVVLNNLIFMVNGSSTPAKHDFSTVSTAGVARPDITNASVATNDGGNDSVKGIVSYFLSQVTGTTEGALSADIGPIDAGDGTRINVDLSHADFVGNTYNVYRTLANGAQPFLVSQVAGGAPYTDDTPDRDLTDLPYLHGDPPLAAFLDMVAYNDRLWAITKDSVLYWSDADNPESWWTGANGNRAPINEDDGDFSVALARDETGIVIFKENHMYRAIGGEPADLQIREITMATQEARSVGLASKRALVPVQGGVAFYWNRGVYLYSGGSVSQISQDIEDDLFAIRNRDESDGVYLGFYPGRRHLYVSVPLSAGTTPTHTYIFDMDQGQWIGRMTTGFRGFLSVEDSNGDEQFWGLSSSGGFAYQLESGQTAAGSAISASLELAPFYGRSPATLKDFFYVEPVFEPKASGTFNVVNTLDGKSSSTESVSVSQVQANTLRHSRRVNWQSNIVGREQFIKITSNADQPAWKLYGLTYGFREFGSVSR